MNRYFFLLNSVLPGYTKLLSFQPQSLQDLFFLGRALLRILLSESQGVEYGTVLMGKRKKFAFFYSYANLRQHRINDLFRHPKCHSSSFLPLTIYAFRHDGRGKDAQGAFPTRFFFFLATLSHL